MSTNDANLIAFNVDLANFAEKIEVAPKIVVARIVLDLFRRITKRTPVDTGRARASWDVKVGSPSTWLPPETKGSVAGSGRTQLGKGLAGNKLGRGALSGGTTQNIAGEVANIDGIQVVYITSNLDYMVYLEDGSSKQAPAGMVLLSVAEIEVEIESILEQL